MHGKNEGIKIFYPKCGFKTDNKATLKVHDRMSHQNDKRKRSKDTICSQCSKCGLTFGDEKAFNSHIKAERGK